jgi:hypothetical protein
MSPLADLLEVARSKATRLSPFVSARRGQGGSVKVALVGTALVVVWSGVGVSSAVAATASRPSWGIRSVQTPTRFAPGDNSGHDQYKLAVTNIGGQATDGSAITVLDRLPVGLTATAISGETDLHHDTWSCELAALTCTYVPGENPVVAAGQILPVITITVSVAPDAPPTLTNVATASGGDQADPIEASAEDPTPISSSPAGFGIQTGSFTTAANNADGSLDTQAGSHPYSATASFAFNTAVRDDLNRIKPAGRVKNIAVALPAGFVGNPQATPKCSEAALAASSCPRDSMVGTVALQTATFPSQDPEVNPVYNMQPNPGTVATFAFDAVVGVKPTAVFVYAKVRTDGDYGVTTYIEDAPQDGSIPFGSSTLTFWGIPADHNGPGPLTFYPSALAPELSYGGPGGGPRTAFLTNPVNCAAGPLATSLDVNSYENPSQVLHYAASSPGVTGCGLLSFEPTIALTPDTTQAETPIGLGFDLQVPQVSEENPEGLASSTLRKAVVTLPAGTSVSPGAADGLRGCSPAEIGLGTTDPITCPDASNLGTVEVTSPLLSGPLTGKIYLGQPPTPPANPNPFTIYIVAEGFGVSIRLAGSVAADPNTGQLTATFLDNPPLTFSDLKLHLKGGPRAPLTTAQSCGPATTTSDLTPWSSGYDGTPDATPSSSFSVDWDGAGAACPPSTPFAPVFAAGTVHSQAGGYSPFTVTLSRSDREQDLGRIQITTPPGLLGMLSSVPLCEEPQASRGECSRTSEIGHTTVGAGAGSAPLYLPVAGQPPNPVFLTTGYKGAPFGLSVVVPAVAGPFNLGNVVVRAAINVDPRTAQVTITSDPLPQILDGIPLRLKTVNVNIDRPAFTFNPTNCESLKVTGTIASAHGASAAVSSPFQAANCANLTFKPSFSASTRGKTSKANGASLVVRVAANEGPGASQGVPAQANISKVDVSLPRALPPRLTTLQKACPEAQFVSDPAGCPPASDVGTAVAQTPVLPVALEGPAYLVSHGGAAFPDLVIVLQGDGVVIDLVGDTQIKDGITYSRFETVPDAPISTFELKLPQGPYSLLGAFQSLCGARKMVTVRERVSRRLRGQIQHLVEQVKRAESEPLVMPTTITGQNGAVLTQTTKIAVTDCPAMTKTAAKRSARRWSRRKRRS